MCNWIGRDAFTCGWTSGSDGQTECQLDCTVVNFVNQKQHSCYSLGNRNHSSFCISKFDRSGRVVEREEEDYTNNNNNKCDAFSCASISRKMSTLDFDSINPVPVIINFYGPLQIAWMRNVCLSLITRCATHQHHSLLCQSVGLIFFCLPLPSGLISGMFITLESSFERLFALWRWTHYGTKLPQTLKP